MNLKKRKHFNPKKEESFLMSLFLSSCFSIQIWTNLVLVRFYYNAAVRRVLKTFRKFAGKRLWWKPFLGKFKLFKIGSGEGVFRWVFRTPFYGCFQTLNRNIPLNYDIVWWKYSRVIKDLSKIGSKKWKLFLTEYTEILRRRTFFILPTRKLYVFSKIHSSQKKSVKLKRFLCKDKSSQNLLKSLV